jgi:hypothetical protein
VTVPDEVGDAEDTDVLSADEAEEEAPSKVFPNVAIRN